MPCRACPSSSSRRDPRADRPQRRREDDDVQLHHRRPSGYRGEIRYDGVTSGTLKPHQRARLKIARTFQNSSCSTSSAHSTISCSRSTRSRSAADRRSAAAADDGLRRAHCAGDGAVDAALHRPRRLRRHAGRRPAGRSTAASRDRTRPLSRAPAAAARRAGVGTRRAGDGPAGATARVRASSLQGHDPPRRPRHGADHAHLHTHLRARLPAGSSPRDRRQKIRDDPQVVRAYLGEPDATDTDSTEPTRREAAELAGDGAGR